MVEIEIEREKLEEILNYIWSNLGIEEGFENYLQKIISATKKKVPSFLVKKDEHYVIVRKTEKGKEAIAEIKNGWMYHGKVKSSLENGIYIIRPKESLESASNVQLLVRPKGSGIEILNIGANPIEIIPRFEWKRKEK